MRINKPLISIFFFFFGAFVLAVWISGSHGRLDFRPHMKEDWVLSGLMLLFWGTPLIFLATSLFKKFRN